MDREKVIKGMEQFRAYLKPFCGNHADWERFDAGLSMLKEQEAVKPVLVGNMWECGNCHAPVGIYLDDIRDDFCRKCGKAVKWK